jgi:hypothetical protein
VNHLEIMGGIDASLLAARRLERLVKKVKQQLLTCVPVWVPRIAIVNPVVMIIPSAHDFARRFQSSVPGLSKLRIVLLADAIGRGHNKNG